MQKRIIVSILLSILTILAALGIISTVSVNDAINKSLDHHLEVARILANHTDFILQGNLNRLYDLSLSGAVDFNDGNWAPEALALQEAHEYSLFSDGIFLLDLNGNILAIHPPGKKKGTHAGLPYVEKVITSGRAVISDVYTIPATSRKLIYVLVPLKDRTGRMVGIAGGEINPTSHMLTQIMKAVPTTASTYLELIDSQGTVIASNVASRVFSCVDRNRFLEKLIVDGKGAVAICHRCHEGGKGESDRTSRTTDILAFAPLTEAPWGVSVREPEEVVFASSSALKTRFSMIAIISVGSALILAIGLSRSIVHPLRLLRAGAERIAHGNLSEPVQVNTKEEIGELADTFETMRSRLADALERNRQAHQHLEHRVEKRTEAIRRHRKRLSLLLHEVMSAQENERKRIARELHDETSQALTALGFGIDVAEMEHSRGRLTADTLKALRQKVTDVLRGVKLLVHDLRPPVVDDLGLESAIQSLLEEHLTPRGMRHILMVTPEFRKMAADGFTGIAPERRADLMVFRIVQEAITNIARHSEAKNVMVILKYENYRLQVYIEDNGRAFKVDEVLASVEHGELKAFGLVGMKERAALLDGTLDIRSDPESGGTLITLDVPLSSLEVQHG